MKKSDWLYPLTQERYAQIQQETEERLFAQCSENEEYRAGAWGVTVRNVESLFQSVLEQSGWGNGCSIRVVQDDSLRPEAVEESAA